QRVRVRGNLGLVRGLLSDNRRVLRSHGRLNSLHDLLLESTLLVSFLAPICEISLIKVVDRQAAVAEFSDLLFLFCHDVLKRKPSPEQCGNRAPGMAERLAVQGQDCRDGEHLPLWIDAVPARKMFAMAAILTLNG